MSLENFSLSPILSFQNPLLRRGDGESGDMSDCSSKSGSSPTSIKLCELMDKAMEENAGGIFNCVRKCKDQACKQSCVYTVLGINMDVIVKSPLIGATAACSGVKGPVTSCKDSCDKSDSMCKSKCVEDHKYDNISCVSKTLEISEDQVKEMTECPKNKCMDSPDISKLFDCIGKCQELPQDSTVDNDDSEEDEETDNQKDSESIEEATKNNVDSTSSSDTKSMQSSQSSSSSDTKSKQTSQSSSSSKSSSVSASRSADESTSLRITTSKLFTFGLVFLSISLNLQ